jgi:hypothetical protein
LNRINTLIIKDIDKMTQHNPSTSATSPLPATTTLGQRSAEFVGALQSLDIHNPEHERIAHRVMDKIHAPRLLHNNTPEELATLYSNMLREAGLDNECVTTFTAEAVKLRLFEDVELMEDGTPWVEPA